jgi:hypothetical protein
MNEDLIKRLEAYITSTEDEVAPINRYADHELIREAIAAIKWQSAQMISTPDRGRTFVSPI